MQRSDRSVMPALTELVGSPLSRGDALFRQGIT
jgi:hypothetical protein